jgi:hypothetical protein
MRASVKRANSQGNEGEIPAPDIPMSLRTHRNSATSSNKAKTKQILGSMDPHFTRSTHQPTGNHPNDQHPAAQ